MGLPNLFQLQKVLIEKEKFFFKKFKETKKGILHEEECPILFLYLILYILYNYSPT